MVRNRLAQPDVADGFLLDGYPRTLDQVAVLDEMLADLGPEARLTWSSSPRTPTRWSRRLLKRAQEQGRADDTEDVIRRRMEVYAEQTEPLTRVYAEQGILLRVDGMGAIEDVRDRVLAALQG